MQCDVCNINPATMRVTANINGRVRQLTLCSDCFAAMRVGSPIMSGGSVPFGPPHIGAKPRSTESAEGEGLLGQFGRNLSAAANAGQVDPVIGREKEIERVIEILNRRNKNNPVLIGEPGVGKTAIAEGLAVAIAAGTVPAKLRGKQVYSLDVASLVADTGIRGQFEERMKQLIAELQSRHDVIAFVDEIHLLVGAGSAQGSMDAGNILKPALARGDIQVIGATTLQEYRRIEKDAALERRFQPVTVNEPSAEETVAMLSGLKSAYETYHQVQFSDEALRACVSLSMRYIADRFLPDKAIDLMDEAGAKANLRRTDVSVAELQAELASILREKEEATKIEAYERAGSLRREELRIRQALAEASDTVSSVITVTEDDIARIVEIKTGIPVRKLQTAEQTKLRDLEASLSRRVVGQGEAVRKVAKAVRRSRTGLRKGNRPIGSFLFVGPTGVGKTELAKSLAIELFGSPEAMIRLDMSEFMEKHTVSKLIGSPPGYVGYEEAGQLTERVRRHPYSLLLLDEIEKAHPDVQHLFLQIMEDGRLTDSQGRTVSFKDTLIIMTSNAGVSARKSSVVGFQPDGMSPAAQPAEKSITDSLAGYFKPEFLNRLDAIIAFSTLEPSELRDIVTMFLSELQGTMRTQGVEISWSSDVTDRVAEVGYHPQFGARPLRRVVQNEIEDRIADVLVDRPEVTALRIEVDVDGQFMILET